jgi:hypothetical protein
VRTVLRRLAMTTLAVLAGTTVTVGAPAAAETNGGVRVMPLGDSITVYPGYSGAYPRTRFWHGDRDTTLAHRNLGEEIKQ